MKTGMQMSMIYGMCWIGAEKVCGSKLAHCGKG